ncbi:MAG: hypothetical protein ABI539_07105, partial [Acidobacteriota bacterium]
MKVQKKTQDQVEKRGRALAARGLVNRDGDHFAVSIPGLRGRNADHIVTRDAAGSIVCDCPDQKDAARAEGFRCEHILAVKFAINSQNTEPAVRNGSSADADADNYPMDKSKTESRPSERGEQRTRSTEADGPVNGQAGPNAAETISL